MATKSIYVCSNRYGVNTTGPCKIGKEPAPNNQITLDRTQIPSPPQKPVCPECKQELKFVKKIGGPPPLMPIIAGVVLLFAIGGGAWYLLTPPDPNKQVEKLLTEAFPWLRN